MGELLKNRYEVYVAGDGAAALDLARRIPPDLILLDVMMPVMDGLEATRKLKARNPDCLVLALTVHDDKQYFMEMLSAGASGYITKQAAADDDVALLDVRAYKSYLMTVAKLKPATINRRLAARSKYCRWAKATGLLADDPTADNGPSVPADR